MAIRSGTLLLGRQLRAKVGREADDATRKLTAAWMRAWDLLSADMEAAVLDVLALAAQLGTWPPVYELRRVVRLQQALLNAQAALLDLGTRAGVTISDAAGNVVRITADSEPDLMASQLPPAERAQGALRFASKIPPSALDAIVARTGQRITASTRQLSAEATDAMNRELIRGVALGTNPRKVGAQMVANLRDGFNGGLARATTIARTEILDSYRSASMYAHQCNADVLSGWVWLATLSNRTCPSCLALNGSEHPISEPGPQDHANGRCARMPMLKSWSDLGIDIPEPPSTIPDARKWFAEQPVGVQRQIMSPGRLGLLDSGQVTWDQIPQRRDNPGWRPSYSPRSLADLRQVAKTTA